MGTRKNQFWRFLLRILIGILADGALATGCFWLQLNLATTSLLFLLAVVLQALGGGLASSVVASVVAAVLLDYFFVPPVLNLRIASPFDAVALLVFLTTSLLITILASRARQEARAAELRRQSLERLYEVSQQLLWIGPQEDPVPKLLKALGTAFHLRAVCLFDALGAETYLEGESGALTEKTRQVFLIRRDLDAPEAQISVRCLQMGGKLVGAIGFEGLADVRLTVGSLTAMVTALLERRNAAQAARGADAAAKTEIFRAAVLDALAHEFKTPLAVIVAAAGGLRENCPMSAEQRELAETIEEEASRLGHLTTRLLRKAEVDRDQVRPRMKQVDCDARVAAMVERYAIRATGRRIRVDRLERPAESMVDEELLRLALTQLLDNAVKYSRSGSQIVVSLQTRRESLAIRIWNDGSSISSADRDRIFERFYRGAHGQRLSDGSGLGLYVARKIARAHGGALDIDLDGTTADSTAFVLMIPLLKKDAHYAKNARQPLSCR